MRKTIRPFKFTKDSAIEMMADIVLKLNKVIAVVNSIVKDVDRTTNSQNNG